MYPPRSGKIWDKLESAVEPTCLTLGLLTEECIAKFMERWPDWSETDILSLRDQFMAFDVNCDGLIDYAELYAA